MTRREEKKEVIDGDNETKPSQISLKVRDFLTDNCPGAVFIEPFPEEEKFRKRNNVRLEQGYRYLEIEIYEMRVIFCSEA